MIVSPWQRFFVQYEISYRAARDRGPALPLRDPERKYLDVCDVVAKAISRKKNVLVVGQGEEIELLLQEFRPAENLVILLFKRSDPNASHQMYSHLKTKILRKSDKQSDEAVAVSTHLIIKDINVGDAEHPKYNAVLEEMPGISKSHVTTLLAKILKEHPYDYEDGRGDSKQTHGMIDMRGIPSDAIGGAVTGGRVPGITLIRSGSIDGLDHGGVLVAKEEKMRVSFKPTSDPISWITKVKNWGRERGWDRFRVDIDMPEKRSRSVLMSRDDDAASVLFVRSVPVDLKKAIETCSHTIVDELVTHANNIL